MNIEGLLIKLVMLIIDHTKNFDNFKEDDIHWIIEKTGQKKKVWSKQKCYTKWNGKIHELFFYKINYSILMIEFKI